MRYKILPIRKNVRNNKHDICYKSLITHADFKQLISLRQVTVSDTLMDSLKKRALSSCKLGILADMILSHTKRAQGPSPARLRPNFGNLGTWKTRTLGFKK